MTLKDQKTTTKLMDWDQFKSLISKLERDGENKYCLLIAIGIFTGLRLVIYFNFGSIKVNMAKLLPLLKRKQRRQERLKLIKT